MSQTETVETLSRAIGGIDAARRVGWAKAYSNAERLDDALRDVNLMRGDRDAFRKGLSFVFGLFMEWTNNDQHQRFRQILEQTTGGDVFLDPNVVKAGRSHARRLRDADDAWEEEQELSRRVRSAERREKGRDNQRLWRNAKGMALKGLAQKYGFEGSRELEAFLVAKGRRPRPATVQPDTTTP